MAYHLKLTHGASFTGVVTASRHKPDVYIDDKATADAAVATGYFDLVTETAPEEDAKPDETSGSDPEDATPEIDLSAGDDTANKPAKKSSKKA